MTIGTLHAWHVAMRGLLLSPSSVRIVHPAAAVHRQAEMGEQSVSVVHQPRPPWAIGPPFPPWRGTEHWLVWNRPLFIMFFDDDKKNEIFWFCDW